MSDDLTLIAANALVPMAPGLPQIMRGAGVVVGDGIIKAVGEIADLRRQFGHLPLARQRAAGVLFPGFINAHTHLELSYQSAEALQGGPFTQWVQKLIAAYPPPEQLEPTIRAALRKGAQASLAAGVTLVGDISRQAQFTRDELAVMARESPASVPRVVSFGEVVGLGKMRDRAAALIQTAAAAPSPPVALSPCLLFQGISPHAPYTVEGPALRACVRRAIVQRLPVMMHLAELAAETPFLRDLSGPLGRDWDLMLKMDIIDDRIPLMEGGPIRWAQRWSLLIADVPLKQQRCFPVLLAHVNYCDPTELAQLSASRASVVYCPRTHACFKHPPHRYRDMLASGINVCLGTDSLASSPDLSVLREAQLLHHRDGTDPYTLLEMITRRAADALGLGAMAGTLAPGKWADILLMPGDPENILETIITQAPPPSAIWIGGRRVAQTP